MAHPERQDASEAYTRIRQQDGVELGPLPEDHVRALIASGILSADDEVETGGRWHALFEVPVFAAALQRREQHRELVEALFDPAAAEAAGLGALLEKMWATLGPQADVETEVEVELPMGASADASVISLSPANGPADEADEAQEQDEVREAPNPEAPTSEAQGLVSVEADFPEALDEAIAEASVDVQLPPSGGTSDAEWVDADDDELQALLDAAADTAPAPRPSPKAKPKPSAPLAAADDDRALTEAVAPSVHAALRQAASGATSERRTFEAEWVDEDVLGTGDFDAPPPESLLEVGFRKLASASFAEAEDTFALVPEDSDVANEATAGALYAEFMRARAPEVQEHIFGRMEALCKAEPRLGVAWLLTAEMAYILERDRSAQHYLRAVAVAPRLELVELHAELTHRLKERGKAPARRRPRPEAEAEAKSWALDLRWGLGAVFAVLLGLGALGLGTELGLQELTFRLDNAIFWVRRLVVGGLGAGLAYLAFMRGAPAAPSVPTPPAALAAAVAVGLPLGVLMPPPIFGGSVGVAVVMGLAHVVAEEILFRGYVDRLLARHIRGWLAPALVSGPIYGLYHLGYGGLLEAGTLGPTLVFAVIGGTAYAVLFHRTKSVIAPFVCHAVAQLTLIGLAS